jgi:hypothetical protein
MSLTGCFVTQSVPLISWLADLKTGTENQRHFPEQQMRDWTVRGSSVYRSSFGVSELGCPLRGTHDRTRVQVRAPPTVANAGRGRGFRARPHFSARGRVEGISSSTQSGPHKQTNRCRSKTKLGFRDESLG